MTSCCIPQLPFSFYQHRAIRADFSGGQITSDAGLLPLRALDERHHLTRDWAALLDDPRRAESVDHDAMALLRQRIYQIVAGYEDANDSDRLRHDPALQIVADQKLGEPLGSQPTFSRWENASSARSLVHLNDALLDQFIRLCGRQVRQRGEILLDIDSTDDPTHGQQQFSFFNGAYDQHMYHPMLIFERHTGCLLRVRLRPGNASSHARIVPMLLPSRKALGRRSLQRRSNEERGRITNAYNQGLGLVPSLLLLGANCTPIAREGHLLASAVTSWMLCKSLILQLSAVFEGSDSGLRGLRPNP